MIDALGKFPADVATAAKDPLFNGVPGTPGTATMIAKAAADYGASLPTDFTGKTWEESRWLGYLIKERAVAMSKDSTWKGDRSPPGKCAPAKHGGHEQPRKRD